MKYYINLTEQRERVFEVEAESEEDAVEKLAAAYDTGMVVLDEDDTGCVGYNPIRNKEALAEIVSGEKFVVLPAEPETYTVEYTLTVEGENGESSDYYCKAEGYESIEAAKDESSEIIKGLIRDYDIPEGIYEIEVEISSVRGEEESHEDWDTVVLLYIEGQIIFKNGWGPDIPNKGDLIENMSDEDKEAGFVKFNIQSVEDIDGINGEGVWGWISPEDKLKYDDSGYHGTITAILCNRPIRFSYKLEWGAEVVLRCHGDNRPTLDPEWIKKYLL